jgi:pseudaminic acid synthase
MSIYIDGIKIGKDEPPYMIAELSANHNGSIERAIQSIAEAKRCGANAVKLQTYTADTMTLDSDSPDFLIKDGPWSGFKLYDLYAWAQTPYEWHKELFQYAKKIGITIFSTPFDETAVNLLEELKTPAYKIASFEITDLPLISYVARTGKPMIMSTGMASEFEIEAAVETAQSSGCSELVLLHCTSSYPAPINQANLRQLCELGRRFGLLTGLSDHTLGTTTSLAAVAIGACIIEKHFTLSRNDKGPDSNFSLEPSEFAHLCEGAHEVWSALGSSGYERQKAEEGSKMFRRSLYFVRDIAAGSYVKKEDIRRIRPGMGLSPNLESSLIGRKLKKDVSKGTATAWDYFDD